MTYLSVIHICCQSIHCFSSVSKNRKIALANKKFSMLFRVGLFEVYAGSVKGRARHTIVQSLFTKYTLLRSAMYSLYSIDFNTVSGLDDSRCNYELDQLADYNVLKKNRHLLPYFSSVQFPRIGKLPLLIKNSACCFLSACSKCTRDQSKEELRTLLYSRYLPSLLY